jgi:hypothetical protein
MSIAGNKKKLIQWTMIVLAGMAVGGFMAAREKKEMNKPGYNWTGSMELLNKKDSLLNCSKDGLNTASMLTKKKDSLISANSLPRRPHD